MTTRRPDLGGPSYAGPGAHTPVAIVQKPGADKSRQVPTGLDSRGFALHRIFCMAGEPRCPSCLAKLGVEYKAPVQAQLFTKVVKLKPPLGAQVHGSNSGAGIYFKMVLETGNAAKAGIIPGDSVMAINGVFIKQMPHEGALDLLTPDTELTCLISTTQDPATTPPSANELEVKAAEEAAEKVAELNAGLPVGHWIVEIERVPGVPLGMQVMPATAVGTGIKVNMVVAGGSAFASKQVFPNSVIHAINGRVINETPHSDAVIMLAEPGTSIRLELHEEESSFAPMETETEDELGAPLMGEVQVNFSVEPNQPLGIQIVPVTLDPKGMRVHSVADGGVASAAGLKPGDEIVFIDSYKCDQIETAAAVSHFQGVRIRRLTLKRPQRVFQL